MGIYKVHLSDLAKADLRAIVNYVASADSWDRAKYVEHGILSTIKQLITFPTMYPKDENASMDARDVRFVVKWKYKIFFFVKAEIVEIVGIFHTAQSPDKLTYYNL
ncbi:hypothetical protein FACS1894199_04670 [Bacteroidia bacterium]|nr:hypothetical protein FACS1894199_04670 [Bacteroidia bacterium]